MKRNLIILAVFIGLLIPIKGCSLSKTKTKPNGNTQIDIGDDLRMNFVSINAGSFNMGSPDTDSDASSNEKPQRVVTITNGFYMGKYEVTQAQYKKIMGVNPSNFTTDTNLPVEQISWYNAVSFCNKLSLNQGLKTCYTNQDKNTTIDTGDTVTCDWSVNGYRLPTEAEWEYCCRASTNTIYSYGDTSDDAYGWHNLNSSSKTHVVGAKTANPWGLHDMHGNVGEWCWDSYASSYYSQEGNADPLGPPTGSARVFRGGFWSYKANYQRSANRFSGPPTTTAFSIGFRVLSVR